jgi:hypothetical protein
MVAGIRFDSLAEFGTVTGIRIFRNGIAVRRNWYLRCTFKIFGCEKLVSLGLESVGHGELIC